MDKKHTLQEDWIRLDTAAKIYPSARTMNWSAVFRLAAVLYEEVDPKKLQTAALRTLPRFPSMDVQIRKGLFWYYLERRSGQEFRVEEETQDPCRPIYSSYHERALLRILYCGRRIAVEFFHALSDGVGAMEFLKTLLAEYLRECHDDIPVSMPGVMTASEDPTHLEYEDSFQRYADPNVKGHWSEQEAYHLSGRPLPLGQVMVTHGVMPADALKAKAREYGVSTNDYLTALIFHVLYKYKRVSNYPLKICIPVNLRRFLPSSTIRNFAMYINVSLGGDEPMQLQTACARVREQIQSGAQAEKLVRQLSLNVKAERSIFLRLAPLPLKDVALKIAYEMFGDKLITTTFTNLGNTQLPPPMAKYVNYMETILGAAKDNPIVFSAVSCNNKFVLTSTRQIRESVIERDVFRQLVAHGIPVSIIANREVTSDVL